jgi:hypothetical protein
VSQWCPKEQVAPDFPPPDGNIRATQARPMKTITAATALLLLIAVAALAEPLPLPKPPGPGGSCPHGYTSSGSFCVPAQHAQDAVAKPPGGTCPWGWTSSGSYCLRSGNGGR